MKQFSSDLKGLLNNRLLAGLKYFISKEEYEQPFHDKSNFNKDIYLKRFIFADNLFTKHRHHWTKCQ